MAGADSKKPKRQSPSGLRGHFATISRSIGSCVQASGLKLQSLSGIPSSELRAITCEPRRAPRPKPSCASFVPHHVGEMSRRRRNEPVLRNLSRKGPDAAFSKKS